MKLLGLISVIAGLTITVFAYAQETRPASEPGSVNPVRRGDESSTSPADHLSVRNSEGIAKPQAARFTYIDVYVDSADKPLAAYQVRIDARGKDAPANTVAPVKIVGIEGGQHAAFVNPPYYDPAAMMNDRVIIAAFNTGRDLPAGKSRVARLHLMIAGDVQPEFTAKLETAATTDGKQITATVSLEQGAHS